MTDLFMLLGVLTATAVGSSLNAGSVERYGNGMALNCCWQLKGARGHKQQQLLVVARQDAQELCLHGQCARGIVIFIVQNVAPSANLIVQHTISSLKGPILGRTCYSHARRVKYHAKTPALQRLMHKQLHNATLCNTLTILKTYMLQLQPMHAIA